MSPAYLLLQQLIKNEMDNIEHVITLVNKSVVGAKKYPAEQDVYIAAVALHLQSIYTGIERIFQLIANKIEQTVPTGSHWHADLLKQMTIELPNLRPSVIRFTTHDKLNDYRSFRHRIRHIYTYNIDPEKVMDLANKLPNVWAALTKDIEQFLIFLDTATWADEADKT